MEKVTLKYKSFGGTELDTVLTRIANILMPLQRADEVREILKGIQAGRDQMSKDYRENVLGKFAKKKEDGSFERPEYDPHGFIIADEHAEAARKANESFGEKEVEIEIPYKFHNALFGNEKFSPRERELLDFVWETKKGPGVPTEATTGPGLSAVQ